MTSYAVAPSGYGLRDNWQLQIFDQSGNLVDVPQADVQEIRVQKVLNGGSGEGTITFRRRFNDIGAVGYTYSFRLWIWPGGTTMPTDPYWTGIQEDPDQVQLSASGQCVVHCYGDFTMLNDGLVSFEANPGVSGNPSLDCAALLGGSTSLIAKNQPPGWLSPVVPSTMFPLLPVTYTHQGLGDVVDDLLKQGRDSTGLLYTWRVTVNQAGQRRVVIKIDQNPNVLDGTGGKPLVLFRHLFANSDFDTYKIANKYRDIYNIVAVYGARDSSTGAQAFGVFSDATSIAELGRVKEYAINVPSLATTDACEAYGEVWLDLNAYPTAEGSCRLLRCDPTIDVGTWVQFWEAPSLPDAFGGLQAPSIKQVRISQVDLVITKPNRVEQSLTSTSPVPYLDKAIYRVGAEIQTQTQISNLPLFPVKQTLYIRSGGTLSSSSDAPAKVALTACEAVFPQDSGDSKIVRLAALPLTQLTDDSGGPNNGQTGDGNYTVSVTRSGSWIITQGDRPANTKLQQNVLGAYVVGGVPFCVDIRILAGYPAFSPDLGAPTLAPSTIVTVGIPANAGAGAVDLPIDFYLDPATWTNANQRLSYFEVGATPSGSTQPIATYTKVIPTSDGHITTAVPGLGSDATFDFYVTAFDNLDRATPALFLATATTAKVKIGVGNVNVDSSLPAPTMSNNGALTNVPDPVDTAHPHPTHGDISTTVDLTNVPGDGSVRGVSFVFREHGTTKWVPAGEVDLVGLPAPTNQNIGFIYSLATGKTWDFACGYVGLGGYGALTPIGTTAQQTSGFQARVIVVQGKYLDNGSVVTPTVAGTQLATLNEAGGSLVGDTIFTVSNTSLFLFPQEITIGSETLIVDSIDSGASQITTETGAAAAHANGSAITAAKVWNGLSRNGISADVVVQFDLTNPPTDGTFARVLMWYRRNGGTGEWKLGGGVPAAGKLTNPETYPTQSSYVFGFADLINSDTYDFAISLQATSGRESNKTIVASGFTALALELPTTALPGIPLGTTVTATGTITGYAAVLGGAYHANFTVTPTVSSTPAFSSWGAGFQILAKVNDTGAIDGDTDHTHYVEVGDLKTNNWSGSALHGVTGALSAGHAYQLAIAPYSQQSDGVGPIAIFALTIAQKIGSGSVADGPNLVHDPVFEHAAYTTTNPPKATSDPYWAFFFGLPLSPSGPTGASVCILGHSDKGPGSFVVLSDANGSGNGGSGVNYQAMSEAMTLKAGVEYCVSADIAAVNASVGAGTGSPSIAIISHDVGNNVTSINQTGGMATGDKTVKVGSVGSLSVGDGIAIDTGGNRDAFGITGISGTTLTLSHAAQYVHNNGDNVTKLVAWDPLLNDPSQSSYAPQTSLVRTEATQSFGSAGIVSSTYTPSEDEVVSVLFQSHGAKSNGTGDGLIVFAEPMLQAGSAPGPFNQGPSKKGRRPFSVQSGNWSTLDGAADTQNNADPGTGGGYHHHKTHSWQAQKVIDVSGRGLLNEFPGSTLNAEDGSLTNCGNVTSSTKYTLVIGQTPHFEAKLSRGGDNADLAWALGDFNSGYVLWWHAGGTSPDYKIRISLYVGGVRTEDLATSTETLPGDDGPHHFSICAEINADSSNSLEASVDGVSLTFDNDSNINLTTGSWGATPYFGLL